MSEPKPMPSYWALAEEVTHLNGQLDQLKAENAKLRELAEEACEMARTFYNLGGTFNDLDDLLCEAAELGVGVDK